MWNQLGHAVAASLIPPILLSEGVRGFMFLGFATVTKSRAFPVVVPGITALFVQCPPRLWWMQLSLLISMSSLMLGGVEDPLPTALMSGAISIEPVEKDIRHVDRTMAWLWSSRHPHTQNKLSNLSRKPSSFQQMHGFGNFPSWTSLLVMRTGTTTTRMTMWRRSRLFSVRVSWWGRTSESLSCDPHARWEFPKQYPKW